MINHHSVMLFAVALLFFPLTLIGETNALERSVAEIRCQVTAIEHQPGDKVKAFGHLIEQSDVLVRAYPQRAEPLLWKGIAILSQAQYVGLKALSKVKEAKRLLEASLALDPQTDDGAAYLALAMLYYQVPPWPLSFRNDKQAEAYFAKALEVSSQLDTHYRYGEYLLVKKRLPQARAQLQMALAFPDRDDHPDDALKKADIRKLLIQLTHE